jgi:hypothetical protein
MLSTTVYIAPLRPKPRAVHPHWTCLVRSRVVLRRLRGNILRVNVW